jgi:hypothetical protein
LNRGDFQALAEVRLVESKTLLDAGRFDGAYYLAGYAVECALKACISRLTREFDFPPDRRTVDNIYTHNLVRLVTGAGLEALLEEQVAADPEFKVNWTTVRLWSEESRYTRTNREDAEGLYNAIADAEHE